MDQVSNVNASLAAVIVGLVLFFIGGRMRFRAIMGHYRSRGGRMKTLYSCGRAASVLGGAVLLIGLYAGLWGPISFGSWSLPLFQYEFIDRMREDALPYARTNIKLTGEPVVGWRGNTQKSFHVTVDNKGDRKVAYIVVRFRGRPGTGRTFEQKLNGPFPPKRRKEVYPRLPSYADTAYASKRTEGTALTIVKAKF